jgi:Pyruvate/2-oxoacid:ferredoxin oxidoreductase gamma subunit
VEREIVLTGVGGQGVQLAAQVLARAAALEGRAVMLFGVYSGMMRGGNSDSTVVVSDQPSVEAPPLISRAWSAIALHHQFWQPSVSKLVDGAVVCVNSSLFEGFVDRERWRVFDVPGTDMAAALGNPMAASMVMAGAYAGITGLVTLDALLDGMRESVPPYRRQHIESNERAIVAGFEAVDHLAAPAWQHEEARA